MLVEMLLASALLVQVPNPPSARLAKLSRLTCSFTTMATGTWKGGAAESSIKPAKLTVAFHSIDAEDGTAESSGNAGKAHITVRLVGSYLHLMQIDPYGALYVTTVMDTETSGGNLQAVHTRHEYTRVSLPGLTSRPEQYYGDCALAK